MANIRASDSDIIIGNQELSGPSNKTLQNLPLLDEEVLSINQKRLYGGRSKLDQSSSKFTLPGKKHILKRLAEMQLNDISLNNSQFTSVNSSYRVLPQLSIMNKKPKKTQRPVLSLDQRIRYGKEKHNTFGFGHGFPLPEEP